MPVKATDPILHDQIPADLRGPLAGILTYPLIPAGLEGARRRALRMLVSWEDEEAARAAHDAKSGGAA